MERTQAVTVRPAGEHDAVLVDLSCGRCPECEAGAPVWCREQGEEGCEVVRVPAALAPEALEALLAAAALEQAPQGVPVLVVAAPGSPLPELVRRLRADDSVVCGDPADGEVREALAALDATGRAPVLVTTGDARRAVKAVRRGGHVCVSGTAVALPSITELVQREVTLLAPRDLAPVTTRIDPPELRTLLATPVTARRAEKNST